MNLHQLLCFNLIVAVMGHQGERSKPSSPERRILMKYVFTNASKHWNHYIRKLLHNSLEFYVMNISVDLFVPSSLFDRNPDAVCEENVMSCLKYLMQHVNKFVFKHKKVEYLRIVSLVGAGTKFKGNSILLEPIKTSSLKGVKGPQYSTLHFDLDPHFYLNMTFHYIYFSSNSFLKCNYSRLTVKSFVQTTDDIPLDFEFCGIVPSFAIYPPSSRVTVTIQINLYQVTFDSIMSHCVIDCDKVVTHPIKSSNSEELVSVMRFSLSKSYFLRYEIEGEKYEKLYILCNISQYSFIEVYDGPGTLYNILEPFLWKGKMAFYNTSTFKTVIVLLKFSYTLSDITNIAYKVTSHVKLHKKIYVEENSSVLITSAELKDTEIKILEIKTEIDIFLKTTIHQINYTGNNHSSCGFAGVSSYDIIEKGNFQKISTICHSNNNQEYEYKSIYTQNPVMLLVMYSFKKYSNFSVTVLVSTSLCKATKINICDLEHDPQSLKSNSMFFIKRQSCIVLQLDYGGREYFGI